jgi:hypothetical protein
MLAIVATGAVMLNLLASAQADKSAEEVRKVHEAVVTDASPAAFDAYLATLPRVDQFYVVEGDMLRTADEMRRDVLLAQGRAAGLSQMTNPELIVMITATGARDYWKTPTSRKLTYAIDRASFKSEDRAKAITSQMERATADWQKACADCGVTFERLDIPNPTHKQVTFIVRRSESNGAFIAAAFFPSYPPSRRYVNIDDSYWGMKPGSFEPVGVLRHELGHVLGYRHEHIRGISGCFQEDKSWQPLTKYDPKSVMHYFCGGAGSLTLEISKTDQAGHLCLYGPKQGVSCG